MGEEPRELFPEPIYKAMNDGYIGSCLKCVQLQQLLTESIESEVALEENGKKLAQSYVDDTLGLREQIITLEQQLTTARDLLREAVEIGEQSWNRTCFGLLWVERAKKEVGDV